MVRVFSSQQKDSLIKVTLSEQRPDASNFNQEEV